MTSLITVCVLHEEKEVPIGDEDLWVAGSPEALDAVFAPWGLTQQVMYFKRTDNADFVLPSGTFALLCFLYETLGDPHDRKPSRAVTRR